MNPNSHWKLLSTLPFLFLSSCVTAGGPNVSPQAYARVLEPPPQYQRPYLGHLTIRYVHPEVSRKACGSVAACAFPLGARCVIIINREYAGHRDALVRHEQAHCLGWPGSHPRG